MSRRARRSDHADLPDVFVGRQAVTEGLLSPAQLRGPLVCRVIHGVYRPAWVSATHELRCRAAGLVMPRGGVITGRSLATVLGVRLLGADDPVEVAVNEGERFGPYRGLTIRRLRRGPEPARPWHETHLGDEYRLALDLTARHPLPLATAYLDAVARAGLLDLAEVTDRFARTREKGVSGARRALSLTDPRSESIAESQVRVILAMAGIVTVPQYRVIASGRSMRVDLAIPELRLAIEYDGGWHALREQLERDRARLNALQAAGWHVVHVTADLLRRPGDLVALVRAVMIARNR